MSRTRGTRSGESTSADGFKSTPIVNTGSFGTSTPTSFSAMSSTSNPVPVGIRDPLVSSRYAGPLDLNPNAITTAGDTSSNLAWTPVRCDRPVLLWPIKSRVSTSSEVSTLSVSAGGSGYQLGQTLTLAGGTGSSATATTSVGRLTAVASVTAAGSNYQLGETVTFSGFTGTSPTARVNSVAIQALTIVSGGTGYTNGSTVTMVGGTGTALQATVTSVGGVVTSLAITIFGTYTALPPQPATFTGGAGSGLTVTHSNYSVQSLVLLSGGTVTAPNNPTGSFSFSGAVGTGGTATVSGYAISAVTLASAGSYTVLPTNPNTPTGGTGTGVQLTVNSYAGTSATSTTFNSGSPRVILYAPNRTPFDVTQTQRSKGAGIVYLPNPGTYYLQHSRDNTAETITTDYIVIDAQDPAVIARYLAESGCHRIKTTVVNCANGAATQLLAENRNRTALAINATGTLTANTFNVTFGTTATSSTGVPLATAASTSILQGGEQVWKGTVSAWNTGAAPINVYVTEWE